MIKIYTKEVYRCCECPEYRDFWGGNLCGEIFYCIRKQRLLSGDEALAEKTPKWCPLSNKKKGQELPE